MGLKIFFEQSREVSLSPFANSRELANGEISEYEHLQQALAKVKAGDKVKTGQNIAQVGNTGYSECPHLHFMVYPKGEEYKTLEIRFLI